MKGKLFKKICAVSLSALMLTGAGAAEIGSFIGTSLPVSAAATATPASSFRYEVNDEGGITITGFTGSETVVTIPSKIDGKSVTEIGDWAFYGCTGLTGITIPSSVTEIGDSAFYGCTGLTSIVVKSDNPSYSSKNGVLFNKNKTKLIAFPSGKTGLYTIPSSVTEIGYCAFSGCTSLTGITIPSSVTKIGNGAFDGCTGLTGITIPSSVTEIGYGAFSDCTGLTTITIPSSVTEIGDWAFKGCTGLTGITIPSSVTEIGYSAFRDCTGLTNIMIPNSVTKIGYEAFYGCVGLTGIIIPSSVTEIGYGAFYYCTGLTGITIPSSVMEIGNYAFAYCTGLTTVTIPSSVKEIGQSAFYGCSGLTGITIPSSVTRIGGWAFYGCTGLTGITIPSSVTEIGYCAFSGCTSLTGITIPSSVTKIGRSAFSGCTGLTGITIPSSVTEIGDWAFYGCTGLTSIVVKSDNPSYSSKNGVLFNKNKTELIAFPGGKTGLYTIPSSVTKIGECAFAYCTGLTGITIPSSVTEIGDSAFRDCTGLTTVTIPDSVTEIGVTEIGVDAFYGCDYLTIKGKKGSYAQTYANKNDIPFEAITFPLVNESSVSTDTLLLGKTVTVTAAAKEGKAPYTYAVWYRNPNNKKWYKAQDYSTNTTVTVKPKQTGAYIIRVNVKDANGKIKKKDFTVNVFAALKNTSTVSATSIKLGKTVTVTAASTGGLGEKQYAVWYQNPNNKKWYKAQDYSANTTVKVKPKQTGAYIIRVNVKDERGKVVKKDYTVNVTK